MSVNTDYEDMMLTDCRPEIQVNNDNTHNNGIRALNNNNNNDINMSSTTNNNTMTKPINPALQSLKSRLSLNLNADRIHSPHTQVNSVIDLNASYEVSQNGTLRTKEFEIRHNGFSVKNSYNNNNNNNNNHNQQQCIRSPPYNNNNMNLYNASPHPYNTSPSLSSSLSISSVDQSPLSPSYITESIAQNDLIELTTIGKGSCGTVRKALHITTLSIVALKNIPIHDKSLRTQLVKELKLLTTLNSSTLIQFKGAYYSNGQTTLILEYMNRNSLSEVVKQHGVFNEILMSYITYQICSCLHLLHSSRKLHRDIKPQNILINNQCNVKITDFGILTALDATNDFARTYIGTTAFMSPERILNEQYTTSSDIWSLGITLIYCLTGELPYKLDNSGMFGLIKAIQNTCILYQCLNSKRNDLSNDCIDFIQQCLHHDSKQRHTAQQLLSHKWLHNAEHNWLKLIQSNPNSNPILQPTQNDINDCHMICNVLLDKFYTQPAYKRSLFELARFNKIGNELGINSHQVQNIFESLYQLKYNNVTG